MKRIVLVVDDIELERNEYGPLVPRPASWVVLMYGDDCRIQVPARLVESAVNVPSPD